MGAKQILVFITVFLISVTSLLAQRVVGEIVDDEVVYRTLEEKTIQLLAEGKLTPMADLAKELTNTGFPFTPARASQKSLVDTEVYDRCRKSVLVIGTLYKCIGCTDEHLRTASGFVISEDGIAVTSYHIFRGQATDERTDLSVVAMDIDGNVFPVIHVLAADMADDVAVIQLDVSGKKIPSLRLGVKARPGEAANVIGHPHNMYYSFTQGTVSRFYVRDGRTKMSVTADFSQGSSGGPILDEKGNVIGIVSATRSLYNTDKHVQMVSREATPVKALHRLFQEKISSSAATDASQ